MKLRAITLNLFRTCHRRASTPCLKLCSLQEVSDSNCVYRNVVDHASGEFTQVLFEDVASDPTLPRTKSVRCAACGHGEAVFFQDSSRCS